MDSDFLLFVFYGEICEAECGGTDADVDPQLAVYAVRVEVGRIHEHDCGGGYEPYHHGPQTVEYGLYRAAFPVSADEMRGI